MSFYSKSPLLLNENRNLGNGVNIAGFENGIYWLKKLLQYRKISYNCPRKWCYWKVWTWIWQLGSIYIGHKKKKFKNNDLIFCQEASNKKYKREFTDLSQIFNGQSGKIINHYFTFYWKLNSKLPQNRK